MTIHGLRDGDRWTRGELLVAIELHFHLKSGEYIDRSHEIDKYGKELERSSGPMSFMLSKIAELDSESPHAGISGASELLRSIWAETHENWKHQISIDRDGAIDGLDIPVEATARVGQSAFRKMVLNNYNSTCCITGLSIPYLLEASHIKPWKYASPDERMDPSNGLLLSVLHHRAFDSGLITIDENMAVDVSLRLYDESDEFLQASVVDYDGQDIRLPEKFAPGEEFLEYHRERVFRG